MAGIDRYGSHAATLDAHTHNLMGVFRTGNSYICPNREVEDAAPVANTIFGAVSILARKATFNGIRINVITAVADYITGTASFTNGSTAVVGTNTVWTSDHVGMKIKLDADGVFYQIASVTDNTHLTLFTAFEGTTGSGAYTIRCFARLGIYKNGVNVYPGDLALDAGEVAVDTTGLKTASISKQLVKGIYFLAYVCAGAPTVTNHKTYGMPPTFNPLGILHSGGITDYYNGFRKAQAYGALPGSFPSAGGNAACPLIILVPASLD